MSGIFKFYALSLRVEVFKFEYIKWKITFAQCIIIEFNGDDLPYYINNLRISTLFYEIHDCRLTIIPSMQHLFSHFNFIHKNVIN